MNTNLESLKNHFTQLSQKNGCVTDQDYHSACGTVTDACVFQDIGKWLLSSGIVLRKGLTPQYQQELQEAVKNPDVKNVKDTKHRTHLNPDKKQKSKIEMVQKDAESYLRVAQDQLRHIVSADGIPYTEVDERNALLSAVESIPDPAVKMHLQTEIADAAFAQFPGYWEIIKGILSPAKEKNYPMEQFTPYINTDPNAGQPPEKVKKEEPVQLDTSPKGQEWWRKQQSLDAIADPIQRKLIKQAVQDYKSKLKRKIMFDTDNVFTVDVADTPAQKSAGLEVFEQLPDKHGLLFVFKPPEHVTFHMGSVKFPIDVIFLVEDHFGLKVSKIVHNAQPGSIEMWSAPDISYVLELPGESCEKFNIVLGRRGKLSQCTEV